MCTRRKPTQSGVTLIELIVFIVIVSVGVTGVLTALNVAVKGSADPIQPKQALAIAESVLEEVFLKNYVNPTDGYTGSSRTLFDDIGDFDALTLSSDLAGNAFPFGYAATVTIAAENTVDLPGIAARKITVSVSQPNGETLSLIGYRANY